MLLKIALHRSARMFAVNLCSLKSTVRFVISVADDLSKKAGIVL